MESNKFYRSVSSLQVATIAVSETQNVRCEASNCAYVQVITTLLGVISVYVWKKNLFYYYSLVSFLMLYNGCNLPNGSPFKTMYLMSLRI